MSRFRQNDTQLLWYLAAFLVTMQLRINKGLIYMKRITLLILTILVTGCSWFGSNNDDPTPKDQSTQSGVDIDSLGTGNKIPNKEYENVFGEIVDNNLSLPPTQLPDEIPISEVREAVNAYFIEDVPEDEQDNNLEPVSKPILKRIQKTLDEDEQLKQLEATVDQVTMQLNNTSQYVVRIVVPHTYPEAEAKVDSSDVHLMNTALSMIGNRLVMISYYDETHDYLIPYHLGTSTYSLFSMSSLYE